MIQEFEELSLNAWPAIQTIQYDGWLIRWAAGFTKRSNSVIPLYESKIPFQDKIETCEAFYQNHNQVVIFKMTNQDQLLGLDALLDSQGYRNTDSTHLMTLNLDTVSGILHPPHFKVNLKSDSTWINTFCRFHEKSSDDKKCLSEILARIAPDTYFCTLLSRNHPVACAMGVLERGKIGIFNLMVAPAERRKGFGTELLKNLLTLGRENGANIAYLQVMENNELAVNLYEKLGFQKAYRYWYRVKEVRNGI